MQRWNGWGLEGVDHPLPTQALAFLEAGLGPMSPGPDASLTEVLGQVPPSRLPAYPLVHTDPELRLRHARGQSLPDWVALRSGRIGYFPDGVARPDSDEAVRALLEYASQTSARLIPYGGGTSVVGHVNPQPGERPVLTVSMRGLNSLLVLDEDAWLATFQAGVRGPAIESALNARGYTLGHFPQSFEFSSLGGWIATRSSGQQSLRYGRIEDLFAGGLLETPRGRLNLPPFPASAAGPDLRQLVLGSEGRLGILIQATVRIRPQPQAEGFLGAIFPDWESGVAAVRHAVQRDLPLSMLRLSDPLETQTTLILADRPRLVAWADRGLRLFGHRDGRCLLVYGLSGKRRQVATARRQAGDLIRTHGGLPVGRLVGEAWRKSRFTTPYLRNTLWESGLALDTLETSAPWSLVEPLRAAVLGAISVASASFNERVMILSHLSHVYRDGASLYITILFRRQDDPDKLLAQWGAVKTAATRAILAHGGTLSHQHGVGLDHAPYMEIEKGVLGRDLLRNLAQSLDPEGTLNPGKLIE